ncbi:MAG: hypothetical protein AAB766_01125, partial [Patescibacteria group bacterium]
FMLAIQCFKEEATRQRSKETKKQPSFAKASSDAKALADESDGKQSEISETSETSKTSETSEISEIKKEGE